MIDQTTGLSIIDIRQPSAPKLVKRNQTLRGFFIALSGQFAYIGNGDMVSVADVSAPLSPRKSGSHQVNGWIEAITASGDYLFAAVRTHPHQLDPSGISNGGLEVIDMRDPAKPRSVAYYATLGVPGGVAISGNYAYLTENPHEILPPQTSAVLHVLDITDPTNPRRVGGNTAFFAEGVADIYAGLGPITVEDGLIFMPLGAEGVAILHEYRPIHFELSETSQGGERRFQIDGPPLVPGRLQRSPDLRTWTDWQPIMFGDTPLSISDSDAPHPAAFYRLVAP